jgi:hypothetical protein
MVITHQVNALTAWRQLTYTARYQSVADLQAPSGREHLPGRQHWPHAATTSLRQRGAEQLCAGQIC